MQHLNTYSASSVYLALLESRVLLMVGFCSQMVLWPAQPMQGSLAAPLLRHRQRRERDPGVPWGWTGLAAAGTALPAAKTSSH